VLLFSFWRLDHCSFYVPKEGMHRITRNDLAVYLSGALKVALIQCKPLLRPNRLPHESDILADALADAALDVVDSDSRMVVETEIYGYSTHGGRQGKWGVDEPDPTVSRAENV
jgi:hypothetical protein